MALAAQTLENRDMQFSLADARQIALLARDAGRLILDVRAHHRSALRDMGQLEKADGSPVTRADHESEAHIVAGLHRLGLAAPIVAEETADTAQAIGGHGFYLIDPLDGTRAFVDGRDDFSVNIGYVEAGRPVMGVLHVPAINETYFTDGKTAIHMDADGAETHIHARPAGAQLDVIINRTEDWSGRVKRYLAGMPVRNVQQLSSAYKLGLVAEGHFDLYPRFGRTYEWDIAAGDAILRAAGGSVTVMDGTPLLYGKPGFENPPFVARGKSGTRD